MASEVNFVLDTVSEADIDLYLGPLAPGERETFKSFSKGATMEDLMVEAGKFPSRGQARKNGWGGPIPFGYSHIKVGSGKNRTDFYILNLDPDFDYGDCTDD